MISEPLTPQEKHILLKLARQSIQHVVEQGVALTVRVDEYSQSLQAPGASFVTLTEEGILRGCVGTIEPYQPLVQDVCEHAAAAATEDFRFIPVRREEINCLRIEISRLTSPQPLEYEDPPDLAARIRPHQDGVVLKDGIRRATFLPQVWEKIPDPAQFLSQLCNKMGGQSNLWRRKKLSVFTYQVEEFAED